VLKDADELASDLHQFSHRLHSSKLQHLGLIAALKDLCRQVSRQHRIAVDLISKDVPNDLPYEVAICFYRIAQEALTNASRHSGANRVTLQISESAEGLLRMQISDAGRGFDPATQSGGLGLASMRERLRLLGGKLRVDSRVGGGTELTAELVVDSYGRRAAA
jgi:signal transduction histidine kinase